MTIEIIIHYDSSHDEKDIDSTLDSMANLYILPDSIRVCVNHPRDNVFSYNELVDKVHKLFGPKTECHLQILTYRFDQIWEVINQSSEISSADYYIFVNAGHEFTSNEIYYAIEDGAFFAEAIDENYNEFACNIRLHKQLGGFGKNNSLTEKIEHKLKMMEEAENAARAKIAESRSDNL